MNLRRLLLASTLALPALSPAAFCNFPAPVAPIGATSTAASTANVRVATTAPSLEDLASYAAREAAAADLGEFSGGHDALWVLAVVVLVVLLIVILL